MCEQPLKALGPPDPHFDQQEHENPRDATFGCARSVGKAIKGPSYLKDSLTRYASHVVFDSLSQLPCKTTLGAALPRDRNRGNDLLTSQYTPEVTATAQSGCSTPDRF